MNESAKSYQIFLESIKSPKTKNTYIKGINHFMRFLKLEDYDKVAKADIDTLQNWLEKWIIDQKNQGLKHNL